jgi:hypothetical protein
LSVHIDPALKLLEVQIRLYHSCLKPRTHILILRFVPQKPRPWQ